MAYTGDKREAVRFAVRMANEHGWPVVQSAKHLGIPQSTLYRWLRAEYVCVATRRYTWVPRVPEVSDLPDAMREGGEGA